MGVPTARGWPSGNGGNEGAPRKSVASDLNLDVRALTSESELSSASYRVPVINSELSVTSQKAK